MGGYETWCDEAAGYLEALCLTLDGLADVFKTHLTARGSSDVKPASSDEQALLAELEALEQRRQDLIAAAGRIGLPSDSLQSVVAALPDETQRDRLNALLLQAATRRRQLHHASMVNWVLTQRSLVHVVQLLEILATGEPQPPTYGKGDEAPRGGLLDSAA